MNNVCISFAYLVLSPLSHLPEFEKHTGLLLYVLNEPVQKGMSVYLTDNDVCRRQNKPVGNMIGENTWQKMKMVLQSRPYILYIIVLTIWKTYLTRNYLALRSIIVFTLWSICSEVVLSFPRLHRHRHPSPALAIRPAWSNRLSS